MELHYRRPNDMTCVANIGKQRKCTIEDRIYIFLTNLDHGWKVVFLATSPLANLKETYSLDHREAQRQVTMGTKDHSEASIMAVHKNNKQPTPFTPIDSSSCFCTHCNNTKYTVDVCQKKHGYPEWYKLKQAERKNKKLAQVACSNATPPASTSYVSQLSSQEGNSALAFISTASNIWIIKSGAIDHMTSHYFLLDSLMSLFSKPIQVVNGTLMLILGAKNVSLFPRLSMSFILLVPSLSNNFFFVYQQDYQPT